MDTKQNDKSKANKRIIYLLLTVLLLCIEVVIALFVHDRFIRPYMGDVLVVVVIYTFIRIFIPEKLRLLPLYIFVFAAGVEGLQYLQIVDRLGLQNNPFLRILIGSVFDWKDIGCYAVGCLLLGGFEVYKSIKLKQ